MSWICLVFLASQTHCYHEPLAWGTGQIFSWSLSSSSSPNPICATRNIEHTMVPSIPVNLKPF